MIQVSLQWWHTGDCIVCFLQTLHILTFLLQEQTWLVGNYFYLYPRLCYNNIRFTGHVGLSYSSQEREKMGLGGLPASASVQPNFHVGSVTSAFTDFHAANLLLTLPTVTSAPFYDTVLRKFANTWGFNKKETFPPFSLMSVCSFIFCCRGKCLTFKQKVQLAKTPTVIL